MNKCKKCDSQLKKGSKYCDQCGATTSKINKEKEYLLQQKDRSNLYFFIGLFLFLLTAFILLAPTKTHHYEVEVSYTDTETYFEKEPYQIEESYQVQEPYETTETYTDTVPVQVEVPYQNLEYYYKTVYKDNCNSNAGCSCTDWGGLFLANVCKMQLYKVTLCNAIQNWNTTKGDYERTSCNKV